MLKKVFGKVAIIRRNLSSLDNQPVGKAALTILLFLDLFILISIFDGLADHTRQLSRPDQLVPQYCRDMIVEGEWNKTTRLTRLANIVSNSRGTYYLRNAREKNLERHPVCEPVAKLFLSIETDVSLADNLKDLLRITRESTQLDSELERINSAYDTSLLERIAERGDTGANVTALKSEISQKTTALDELVKKRTLLESSLVQDERIRELFSIIDNVTAEDRDSLRNELRQINFWYPVKRLGMEMLFLLPLFLIFYFWNSTSITARRPFQTLVSSHLLVVVFIPVLFKIIELVYDIIPKKLLKHIMELLESLKLVALWHYLLMAIIILLALGMIYLFQKKLFSRDKQIEKRISKGACQECGKQLPTHAAACPFCGFTQFKPCGRCHKPTYIYGKYCRECGFSE